MGWLQDFPRSKLLPSLIRSEAVTLMRLEGSTTPAIPSTLPRLRRLTLSRLRAKGSELDASEEGVVFDLEY